MYIQYAYSAIENVLITTSHPVYNAHPMQNLINGKKKLCQYCYFSITWSIQENIGKVIKNSIPGKIGCPAIPSGAIPRLFIAVAHAVGSDIGNVTGAESTFSVLLLSAKKK